MSLPVSPLFDGQFSPLCSTSYSQFSELFSGWQTNPGRICIVISGSVDIFELEEASWEGFQKYFHINFILNFLRKKTAKNGKKPPASIRSLQALIGFLRHWKRVFTRDTVPLKWKLQRISVLQASPILFTARKWYIRKKEISSWPYYALVKGLIIHTWANNTCTFSTMIF
jgi:hypothetical protein